MTRAERREIKRRLKNEIAEFLNIQHHYFPELIDDIKKVLDLVIILFLYVKECYIKIMDTISTPIACG